MTGRLPSGPSDPYVQQWLTQFEVTNTPVWVQYVDQREGYLSAMCHVNAKHAAKKQGGERVLGWSIFLFDVDDLTVAHAEPHSVLKLNGSFVDVTPPKWGHTQVLFVEDSQISLKKQVNGYLMPSERSCMPAAPFWRGSVAIERSTYKLKPKEAPQLESELNRLGLKDMI